MDTTAYSAKLWLKTKPEVQKVKKEKDINISYVEIQQSIVNLSAKIKTNSQPTLVSGIITYNEEGFWGEENIIAKPFLDSTASTPHQGRS